MIALFRAFAGAVAEALAQLIFMFSAVFGALLFIGAVILAPLLVLSLIVLMFLI